MQVAEIRYLNKLLCCGQYSPIHCSGQGGYRHEPRAQPHHHYHSGRQRYGHRLRPPVLPPPECLQLLHRLPGSGRPHGRQLQYVCFATKTTVSNLL
jgi:hypothetical protein